MKFRIVILLCIGWVLQPATAQPPDGTQSSPTPVLIIGPDPSSHLQQDDDLQSLIEQQQALAIAYSANPILGGMLNGVIPGQQISAEHLNLQLNQQLWMLGAYPEHQASFWEHPGLEFGIGMSINDYAESARVSVDVAREVAISQSESLPFLQPGLTGGGTGPNGEPLPIRAGPGNEALSNHPLASGAGSQGVDVVIVGTFRCEIINAQWPHKGSTSGTVKAKADATCTLSPTGVGTLPPDNQTIWTLVMVLSRQGTRGWGPFSSSVTEYYAIDYFVRDGHQVSWHPDTGGGQAGTQVDSGVCRNGRWRNNVSIFLTVPPDYVVLAPLGSLVNSAARSATVDAC